MIEQYCRIQVWQSLVMQLETVKAERVNWTLLFMLENRESQVELEKFLSQKCVGIEHSVL